MGIDGQVLGQSDVPFIVFAAGQLGGRPFLVVRGVFRGGRLTAGGGLVIALAEVFIGVTVLLHLQHGVAVQRLLYFLL